jgi:hypothetical protein
MIATDAERARLDVIEPYVLLSASMLISSAFQHNQATLSLLSRPQVASAAVNDGRVEFELPEWFPVEEALLSTAEGGLWSVVKHLGLPRSVRSGKPSTRIHRLELGPESCREGESVSLTYSPWFRFAAPPYRFDVGNLAAYVTAAFGHLARLRGLGAQVETSAGVSVLWLSERLRVEVIGATELTEIAILLDGDETSVSFANPQLSVARRMFPDIYAALRSASEAGERFVRASLLIEEDQVLLYGDEGAGNVSS